MRVLSDRDADAAITEHPEWGSLCLAFTVVFSKGLKDGMVTTSPVGTSAPAGLAESEQVGIRKRVHHPLVIVGGGAGGITVAAQLRKQRPQLGIAIIEPSSVHYYQPGWTLVGGGVFKFEDTIREEASVMPKGVTWLQERVVTLDPDNNAVITEEGTQVTYDYLVIAAGIQIDWGKIKGLPETLGRNGVTSNYSHESTQYTWELIKNFKGGNAIFTFPSTPIKCAGAPQKIMYMAADYFRSKSGVGVNSNVIFCTAGSRIFGVPVYAEVLKDVVARYNIDVRFSHNLKEVRGEAKEAIFDVTTEDGIHEVTLPFEMLHVAPPMSAPDFIKNSPLSMQNNPGGWVEVDKFSLQHVRYPNVFSIGDASSAPTSKTAAAVRGQAPVLVKNLLAVMDHQPMTESYDGYTCCPLITGYNYTIMAEFDYDGNPVASFIINPAKERWVMWLVKRHLLPFLYWERMLKGAPFEGHLLKPLRQLLGK